MIEKANMQEGKSKYGWYAKMYVKMLLRLLSLPFIFLIIKALKTNKADIVIGSRFLTKNKIKPKWRIVGMKVLNLFTRLVGNIKTTDSQSGYRAYSRRAIEKIKITNPDMGAGSEILAQSKNYNLKVVEIPITVRYDIEGTSSKNPVSHGVGVLMDLIRDFEYTHPLHVFGGIGILILGIGIGIRGRGLRGV